MVPSNRIKSQGHIQLCDYARCVYVVLRLRSRRSVGNWAVSQRGIMSSIEFYLFHLTV